MAEPRKRAITASDNDIGQERHKLYKSSFSWIKKSIGAGYYLEAISVVESLVADRLESYLSMSIALLKGTQMRSLNADVCQRHGL